MSVVDWLWSGDTLWVDINGNLHGHTTIIPLNLTFLDNHAYCRILDDAAGHVGLSKPVRKTPEETRRERIEKRGDDKRLASAIGRMR